MIETLLDKFGDAATLMMAGGLVGVAFGAVAQHSRFCLRSATIEVSEHRFGPQLAVWLLAFCSGLLVVQGAVSFGWLDVSQARQIAATGSLSGAVIGGLIFGAGMILARGCASRLLVLSATGNLRALVTGLVLTLVAQASLRGGLAPLREGLAALWTVPGGAARDLSTVLGLGNAQVALISLVALAGALILARIRGVRASRIAAACGVGVSVGLGWLMTYAIAQRSFDAVSLSSVSFTGPATDTLMGLVSQPALPMSFGIGLVPGVFVGSAVMAYLAGEVRIQRFGADTPMERHLAGAALMGFGSMLAGGCAVGAGMSGGAVLSLTAWVAVFCMWIGAMVTHRLVGRSSQVAATS